MIPTTKQAAAMRYVMNALDTKKLAKSAEAFRLAYKVDLMESFREAQRTIEVTPPADAATPDDALLAGAKNAYRILHNHLDRHKESLIGEAHVQINCDLRDAIKAAEARKP